MRAATRLVAVGLWLSTGLGCSSVQTRRPLPTPPVGQPAVLQVPYLPQTVLLCGGAAIAMVERWWGRRGVYAEDFADLVRPSAGGILTTDLEAAAVDRGWNVQAFQGTRERVQESVGEGVPVVALIEVARERYHYVVVLGWGHGRVVFHDPAAAPFKTMDEGAFLAQWAGANRWALVVRPGPIEPVDASADSTAPAPRDGTMPCPPWMDRALDAVAVNQLDDASRLLAQARRACPQEPLVLRETAGVRFKQGRYGEASRRASEYLAWVPDDEFGWQLLATSRYLAGDPSSALDAWNTIDRPTVDLVRIDGVRGIRFRTIAGAISMPPGTLLTPSRLARARRRVSDIPALRRATVQYQPVPGGLAEIRAVVVERPTVEPAWRVAVGGAVRAIGQREVGLEVASPTGAGELWTGSWRWEEARPRGAIRLDMPVHQGVPGVLSIEGARERFRFALDPAGTAALDETRRSAAVGFGGWNTARFRTSAALRRERWSGNRRFVAVSIGAGFRARDDRVEMSAKTEHAVALSAHPSYTRAIARAEWASALGLNRAAWSFRLGLDWADRHAPLGTWPVAGAALSWTIPLRAHAPTVGGFLDGRRVGRRIIHAGLAGDRPLYRNGPLVIAAGLFLDAAQVAAPADDGPDARFYVDGGAGLRIGVAGVQLGVLRIDLARSLLVDREFALTLGVHRNWPLGERESQ